MMKISHTLECMNSSEFTGKKENAVKPNKIYPKQLSKLAKTDKMVPKIGVGVRIGTI